VWSGVACIYSLFLFFFLYVGCTLLWVTACITPSTHPNPTPYPPLPAYRHGSRSGSGAAVTAPLPPYLPNMEGYFAFPQPSTNVVASQRTILRCMWDACHFSGDVEGTILITNSLLRTEYLAFHEFTATVALVRDTASSQAQATSYVQALAGPALKSHFLNDTRLTKVPPFPRMTHASLLCRSANSIITTTTHKHTYTHTHRHSAD